MRLFIRRFGIRLFIVLCVCVLLMSANSLDVEGAACKIRSITLNPNSVIGGISSGGTVVLNRPAPPGGAVVFLSSSNTSVTGLPASVTIRAGASSETFPISTSVVSASTSVTISATYGFRVAAGLTVLPVSPTVSSLTFNPSTVTGGDSSQGTLTLSAPAPSAGTSVSLSSSDVTVATVPSSVAVPAGVSSATFTVTTAAVSATSSATISALYGSSSGAATLIVTAPLQGTGNIYYVAPTGSDSNPGTQGLPFRNIQKAADVVNPGDTVIVLDGTYTDPDGDGAIVTLSRGGTSTSWVTFMAEHKWGAKLDGQDNTSDTGWRFGTNGNYIRIEGFEVFGVGNVNGSGSGFEIYNGGHDVQIIANHIHHVGRLCTDTTNGEVGIFIQQARVVVDQNLIHDIGRFAPGESGCSPATAYYKNHDHGIYIDKASDITVSNNIFYNTKRGWAVQVFPGPSDRIAILNNTFAFENPYNYGHIIMAASGTGNRIENNIFYDPNTAAIYFYTGTQTSMVVSNNITFSGTIKYGSTSGVIFANNRDNTNPMLVSPASFDFHLQLGSPAVDAGLTLLEALYDFDGHVRPQGNGNDIGACELTPSY